MSNYNLRDTVRIDYKELSETGDKVGKSTESVVSIMAAEARVRGELAGYLFQMEEMEENVGNTIGLSLMDLRKYYAELKQLRFAVVKVTAELKSLQGEAFDRTVDADVEEKMKTTKSMLSDINTAIRDKETKNEEDVAIRRESEHRRFLEERRAKHFVFTKDNDEVNNLISQLEKKFCLPDVDEVLSCEEILKKKDGLPGLAADFKRLQTLMDKSLTYTDVSFENKELTLNNLIKEISAIERMKKNYEDDIRSRIEDNDLTEQKIKLSTLTKIDIGKCNGSMEKGMDYYTFKSKFLKAYSNHPKVLLVEWLVNNHLEGKAKECVGSLDSIDLIWDRLKRNFGNTEQMLYFHFDKINKLGPIYKQKSYESKRYYLQNLINTMQDVFDVATKHDLLGDLHYGPQLSKITGLLEAHIQNKWFKILADEELKKDERWMRMIAFLNEHLLVIQVRIAELKPAASEGTSTSGEKKSAKYETSKGNSRSFNVTQNCPLCDERHPNTTLRFTNCKTFLLMSPKERNALVREKHYCLQCLNGKGKWQEEHECSDKWICRNTCHENQKYKKRLHFLVCAYHVDDEANKSLYSEFKEVVLKADWQKKLHSSIYISKINQFPAWRKQPCNSRKSQKVQLDDVGSPAYILQPYPFNNHVFS